MRAPRATSGLTTLATLLIILLALHYTASVVVPVLTAVFIAAAAKPLIDVVHNRGASLAASIAAAIATVALVMTGLALLTVRSALTLREEFPAYKVKLFALKNQLMLWIDERGLSELTDGSSVDLMPFAGTAIGGTLGFFGKTLLVSIIAIFLLVDLTRADRRGHIPDSARLQLERVQHYLGVKALASAATGIAAALWTWGWGLDAPLLWGLLAFLLNFIPVFGSIIAAIPPVIMAMLDIGPAAGGLVAGGYLVINFGIGNGIEPKLMGDALGISPAVVLLAVMIWTWTFGTMGALLAVPLTVAAKIYFESTSDMTWVADILGGAKASPPSGQPVR